MTSPAVAVDSSLEALLDALGEFLANFAAIRWPAMALALALYLGMLACRARAWQNVLRAAYPLTEVPYRGICASFLAGAGINSVLPARGGDAAKVVLAKGQVRGSSYPAVTSSFLVQTPFDLTAGLLVLAYAISQGLLPRPPELPDLPAFDISFWARNPDLLMLFITALGIGLVILFAVVAPRVELFWARVRQGAIVLAQPGRYLGTVASWQAAGWVFRFGAVWLWLEAFNIGGSFEAVMLVFSVQALTSVLPFTPGGLGAQQALLVATLEGPSRAAILSYSIGQQIAIASWTAVLGFVALVWVFRRTDWRNLIREGREASEAERLERELAEREVGTA